MPNTIRLQREDFDPAAETAALTRGRTDIGAVVSFIGICRGAESGAPIAALTLEHYPGMAEAEIARHVDDANARWPLLGVTVIHRYGRIVPGENIVLVVTRVVASRGGVCRGRFPDGFSQDPRAVLEAGRGGRHDKLGRSQGSRRCCRRSLAQGSGRGIMSGARLQRESGNNRLVLIRY